MQEPSDEDLMSVVYLCRKCPFSASDKEELKNHLNTVHKSLVFPCYKCGFSATDRAQLRAHIAIHEQVNLCSYCDFSTLDSTQLANHIDDNHNFSCMECLFSCNSSEALRTHISKLHFAHVFCCSECPFTTKHEQRFMSHVRVHFSSLNGLTKETFNCPDCQFSSDDLIVFDKHREEHLIPLLPCLECSFASREESALKEHSKTHEKTQFCKKCSYYTNNQKKFKEHLRTHIVHKCPECIQSFKDLYDLQVHVSIHNLRDKEFSCVECGKEYENSSKLRMHIRCHSNRLYTCPKCAYTTKYPYMYKTHMNKNCQIKKVKKDPTYKNRPAKKKPKVVFKIPSLIKQETKGFNCRRCPFTSSSRSGLMVHIASLHKTKNESSLSNEEPSKSNHHCDTCGYIASSNQNLLRHKAKHRKIDSQKGTNLEDFQKNKSKTGDVKKSELHSCSFCHFSFRTQSAMIIHVKYRHSKQKSVACEHCGAVCVNAIALKQHFMYQHSSAKKECLLCKKLFRVQSQINLHIRRCHPHQEIRWCIYCNHKPTTKQDLITHLEENHAQALRSSKISSAIYCHNFFMDGDKRKKFFVKRFECVQCDFKCVYKSQLRAHLTEKHPDTRFSNKTINIQTEIPVKSLEYPCPKCDKSYSSHKLFTSHYNYFHAPTATAEDERIVKKAYPSVIVCPLCPQLYLKNGSLMRHVSNKHKETELHSSIDMKTIDVKSEMYQCDTCQLSFSDKALLLNHMSQHEKNASRKSLDNGQRFACSKCDLVCNKRNSLSRHFNKKHVNDEDKLECPHCTGRYCGIKALNAHILKLHPTNN